MINVDGFPYYRNFHRIGVHVTQVMKHSSRIRIKSMRKLKLEFRIRLSISPAETRYATPDSNKSVGNSSSEFRHLKRISATDTKVIRIPHSISDQTKITGRSACYFYRFQVLHGPHFRYSRRWDPGNIFTAQCHDARPCHDRHMHHSSVVF